MRNKQDYQRGKREYKETRKKMRGKKRRRKINNFEEVNRL